MHVGVPVPPLLAVLEIDIVSNTSHQIDITLLSRSIWALIHLNCSTSAVSLLGFRVKVLHLMKI